MTLYDMVGYQDPKMLITSYYWRWSPVEDKLTIQNRTEILVTLLVIIEFVAGYPAEDHRQQYEFLVNIDCNET